MSLSCRTRAGKTQRQPQHKQGASSDSAQISRANYYSLVSVGVALLWIGIAGRLGEVISADRPLPSYRLLIGGEHHMETCAFVYRNPARLGHASTLRLTLQPEHSDEGPISIQPFWLQNGHLERWSVWLQGSHSGVFRLNAPVAQLPQLREGKGVILFLIGRPSRFPLLRSDCGWFCKLASLLDGQLLACSIEVTAANKNSVSRDSARHGMSPQAAPAEQTVTATPSPPPTPRAVG